MNVWNGRRPSGSVLSGKLSAGGCTGRHVPGGCALFDLAAEDRKNLFRFFGTAAGAADLYFFITAAEKDFKYLSAAFASKLINGHIEAHYLNGLRLCLVTDVPIVKRN